MRSATSSASDRFGHLPGQWHLNSSAKSWHEAFVKRASFSQARSKASSQNSSQTDAHGRGICVRTTWSNTTPGCLVIVMVSFLLGSAISVPKMNQVGTDRLLMMNAGAISGRMMQFQNCSTNSTNPEPKEIRFHPLG